MNERADKEKAAACGPCGWTRWLLGNATSLTACWTALTFLRLVLGVIFVAHGAQKAFGWFGGQGFAGTVSWVRDTLHFPAAVLFAVLLIIAELGGGICLILGMATRIAGALIVLVMFVALMTVHHGQGFFETHLQQMILAVSLALIVAGGGGLSLLSANK